MTTSSNFGMNHRINSGKFGTHVFCETLQLASGKVNSAEFQWIRKLPLKWQTRLSSWV